MTQRLDREIRDTGRLRRHHRAGTVFWTVVVLVPVLACVLVVTGLQTFRPTPPPAGDPLLDRYLQALAGQRGIDWHGAHIQDREFARWEDEFGDDPDYWMLRFLAATDLLPAAAAEERDDTYNPYYIREARRRGAVDGPLLKSLLLLEDIRWSRELESLVAAGYPSYHGGPEAYNRRWMAYWSGMRELINEHHGAEFRELLAEFQAAAPEAGMTWYLSAKYTLQSGDSAGALELVRRGNRAPQNDFLGAELNTRLLEMIRDNDPWLADPVIAASLINTTTINSYYEGGGLTGTARVLANDAALRGSPADLDELHRMACRLGAAQAETVSETWDYYRSLLKCRTAYINCCDFSGMTPEQAKAFQELNARLDTIHSLLNSQYMYATYTTSPLTVWLDSYYVFGNTRMKIDSCASQAHVINNLAATQDQLRQAYLDLERFSYTSLPWDKPRENPPLP